MAHPEVTTAHTASSDIIDALLGIHADSALGQVRSRRPEATQHAQGAYAALFSGASTTGVSRTERFAAALRVASLHAEPVFVEHYSGLLRTTESDADQLIAAVLTGPSSDGLPVRLAAILAHADLLVIRPAAATPEDLDALRAASLSAPEIVTVSQLIAFTAFHIRVSVGLSLIGGAERPAPASRLGPQDAPDTGFTQDQLGWTPWIEPFTAEDATAEQRAVLPGQRLDSPYFRLLALDPTVLGERTATDMGIFYTHGGLPRPERELSATVTSRLNGCIFCASVHSRFAAQLSKRTADVQRVLDDGVQAALDPRWRAIADLAAALTVTPPAATPGHVKRLRELGLDDLELLDVVQASAFFGWANRLMLSLGEPVRSAPVEVEVARAPQH